MRLSEANVFNLLLNLQNIFRDLFKKKAILLRFQFSKFSAIYKTPIVILYRRLADINLINIPKYSKKNIHIYIPQDGRSNCWDLCWQGRLPFLSSVYFSRRSVSVSVQAKYSTDMIRYPISPFLYTAEPPTVRCPPKRS